MYFRPFYSLRSKTARHPLATLFLVLTLLFFISSGALWLLEDDVKSFGDALLIGLPPFLGQIFENRDLETGRLVISLIGVVASIGSLAIITALIVTRFIKLCLKGGRIVNKVRMRGHIVICGWNTQGETVVRELLEANTRTSHNIVILAELEKRPVQTDRVEFISGNPAQDRDLRRARVQDASSVMVLTDFTQSPNDADAKALLIVLAVESLNREVHSCVQILNSANRIHFEHANADEIICLDQLGANLAVAAILNHGTSYLVSELLAFNSGSEFYRYSYRLSDELVEKEFAQAVQALAKRHILLLAIETDYSEELEAALPNDILYRGKAENNRVMVVNPQGTYRLQQGDVLFLIAESEPTTL
jgi:voltage-gated potassium channel